MLLTTSFSITKVSAHTRSVFSPTPNYAKFQHISHRSGKRAHIPYARVRSQLRRHYAVPFFTRSRNEEGRATRHSGSHVRMLRDN